MEKKSEYKPISDFHILPANPPKQYIGRYIVHIGRFLEQGF